MKKEIVEIDGIRKNQFPFNHVVKAGNFLFLSSQLSVDLKTNKILKGNITEQTRQTLENIKFLLESSGAAMNDILKVVVYMRKLKEFDKMNQVYREYFENGQEPARVTIQAKSPIKNIDIEIEVTALLP
ncbi:MAG: RidA family protein [Candidatus Lokiarchaeota archaeon]|nr:RidA family protein [Candidatus Lokiarchaeota archaeon]